MFKRIITVFLLFAFMLSLLPVVTISADTSIDLLKEQLTEVVASARPLLYGGNTEQTGKYLYDRLLRAEAAIFNNYATEGELTELIDDISTGVTLLAPMKGSEEVDLLSFDHLSAEDLALMTSSVGALRVDTENKPEGSAQSVEISGDGMLVYDNGVAGGIVGTSPFGMDMSDTDGLRLWVGADAGAVISVTVGKRSGADDYTLTVYGIRVEGDGYKTLPY